MTIAPRSEQLDTLGKPVPCEKGKPIAAQGNAPAAADTSPPVKSVVVVDPRKKAWFGIELVDRKKKPVPHAPWEVTLPDGGKVTGNLDANGKSRIEGIDPGQCTVKFPTLDRREFL